VFKSTLLFLGISLLASIAPSHGASSSASSKPLDQDGVKRYYNDGDFNPAIAILEDFQKTHATFSREESLMVYKYLGVMYSADQGSREKGKSYFYKLLRIDPEAKILDMYVSIVVQDIFKSTLDELMGQDGFGAVGRKDRLSDAGPKPGTGPGRKEPEDDSKSQKVAAKRNPAMYWWIGGLAVAGAAASGYYLLARDDGEKAPDRNIDIP
jgi:hypothetical protein